MLDGDGPHDASAGQQPTDHESRLGRSFGADKEGMVPLSEHEQRLLDEIEQALYAEDPKFASSVRAARRHRRLRNSALLCVLGVLVGLGLILIGLLTTLAAISVVGFVLVVASVGYAVQSFRHRSSAPAANGSGEAGGAPARSGRPGGLRSRMEDRMRRRFDEN